MMAMQCEYSCWTETFRSKNKHVDISRQHASQRVKDPRSTTPYVSQEGPAESSAVGDFLPKIERHIPYCHIQKSEEMRG